MRDSTGATAGPTQRGVAAAVSGLAVAVLGTVAVWHSIVALYASGQSVARLSVQEGEALTLPGVTLSRNGPRATRVGPVELSPAMNPLRLVLHAGYTPRVGNRMRYRIAMVSPDGTHVWEERRFLGGDEDASYVQSSSVVRTFDVAAPDLYSFEITVDFMTLDDLNTASLEVRRNVARVNAGLIALCSIGAVGALVVHLVSRSGGPPREPAQVERAA
jgi:hypothetical protein